MRLWAPCRNSMHSIGDPLYRGGVQEFSGTTCRGSLPNVALHCVEQQRRDWNCGSALNCFLGSGFADPCE